MPTLNGVFLRLSKGASSLSAEATQKALIKTGGFGPLSPTRGLLKKGVEKALAKADADGNGQVDAAEFSTALRSVLSGKTLPAWSEFDPGSTGSLSHSDLAELVKTTAKKSSTFGGMVDADGIARIIIAIADDDGDGKISKAEFDSLAADLQG